MIFSSEVKIKTESPDENLIARSSSSYTKVPHMVVRTSPRKAHHRFTDKSVNLLSNMACFCVKSLLCQAFTRIVQELNNTNGFEMFCQEIIDKDEEVRATPRRGHFYTLISAFSQLHAPGEPAHVFELHRAPPDAGAVPQSA